LQPRGEKEQTNEETNERTNERRNERRNERASGRASERTNEDGGDRSLRAAKGNRIPFMKRQFSKLACYLSLFSKIEISIAKPKYR